MTEKSLIWDIIARDHASQTFDKVGKSVGQTESRTSRLTKGFGAFGTAAKVAAVGGVGLLGAGLVEGFKAAANYQKIQAQTTAVLKSTGGAAGLTGKNVQDLANKVSDYSGIADETIQSNENMLLTFTGIKNEVGKGNDIFTRATKTVADMSVALGQDGKSSAIQLGKALNDPVKGITALQRVGVSFTDSQKKQIKAMVDSGHTMKAQKVILGELHKEFGGSAKAAGSTFSGSMTKLKNAVGDMLRDALLPLLPKLTVLAGWLADHLPQAAKVLAQGIGKVKDAFKEFEPFIQRVVEFMKANPAVVKTFVVVLGGLAAAIAVVTAATAAWTAVMDANPIGIVVIALAALAAAFVYAYKHSEKFRAVVQTTMAGAKAVITGFVHGAVALWHAFGANITAAAKAAWNMVKGVIGGDLKVIQGVIKVVTSAIHGNWSGVWQGLKMIVSGAFQAIVSIVRGELGIALGLIKGLPGKIVTGLGKLDALLVSAGHDVIWGFIHGIESMAGNLIGAIKSTITDHLPGFVKKALGIASPSKVFAQIGVHVVEGLIQGLGSQYAPLTTVLGKIVDAVKGAGAKLKQAISDRNSFAGGFQSFATSIFGADFGSDDQGNPNSPTASSIIAMQQAQARQASALRHQIHSLVKMGLSPALIKQLQAAGSAGLPEIQALANATPAQIRALNAAQKATSDNLRGAGMTAADDLYGGVISRDRKDLNDLKVLLREIRDATKGQNEKDLVARVKGGDLEIALVNHQRVHKGGKKLGFQK